MGALRESYPPRRGPHQTTRLWLETLRRERGETEASRSHDADLGRRRGLSPLRTRIRVGG